MALRVDETVLNAAADAAVGLVNTGASIEFYTGTRPAAVGDVATGTLLVSVAFEDPAFAAAVAGSSEALGVPLASVGEADGDIGWARVIDGGGNPLWDEDDVGTAAGNAITVNTVTVSTGVNFEVTSYTFFAAA